MPNALIKKDSKRGKGSVKSLEKKWDRAKGAAGEKNGKQNWALTNYIYQKMRDSKHASVQLNAATRLLSVLAKN